MDPLVQLALHQESGVYSTQYLLGYSLEQMYSIQYQFLHFHLQVPEVKWGSTCNVIKYVKFWTNRTLMYSFSILARLVQLIDHLL